MDRENSRLGRENTGWNSRTQVGIREQQVWQFGRKTISKWIPRTQVGFREHRLDFENAGRDRENSRLDRENSRFGFQAAPRERRLGGCARTQVGRLRENAGRAVARQRKLGGENAGRAAARKRKLGGENANRAASATSSRSGLNASLPTARAATNSDMVL